MNKKSFIRYIRIGVIILLLGFGLCIVAIDIIGPYRDFKVQTKKLRADYMADQKRMIKDEVLRAVAMIYRKKAKSEFLTKQKIKARVYEAYAIANNIYSQNIATKDSKEIEKMIMDALRPIRYENGVGYYFVERLNGIEMLNPTRPHLEGQNLIHLQDARGKYVVKELIDIINKSGEGFCNYLWMRLGSAGSDYKKISFVKRFEPYQWFIGTGLYVEDIEEVIRQELMIDISKIRFAKEGYVFVTKSDGASIVSGGRLYSGTKKAWDIYPQYADALHDYFRKATRASLKPDGDYIYYSHVKLTSSNKPSPKVSFIYEIPEWNLHVGAGVYLDDIESDIIRLHNKLIEQIKDKVMFSIVFIMGAIVVLSLMINILNRKLSTDFNLFIDFFNKAASSNESINRDKIQFVELDIMAKNANIMLEDKIHAQQDLFVTST